MKHKHDDPVDSESRRAFRGLLDALRKIEDEYLDEASARDGEGHRFLMHLLGGGLDLFFETDALAPEFRPTLQFGRKFYGDNPDAVYHFAPIEPDLDYEIRGNLAGAVYLSFAVEAGGGIDERYPPARVDASLNDAGMEIGDDGEFVIIASQRTQPGNWLPLSAESCSIVARHYFEGDHPVDRRRQIPLEISVRRDLDVSAGSGVGSPARSPSARPPVVDSATVAQGIRRVEHFVRGLSLDYAKNGPPVDFFAAPPNRFGAPPRWDPNVVQAAVDQVNLTAPFALEEDEALVIEGRFPPCRFANIVLWNRHLQTFEYRRRRSSLNRRQLECEPDGRFRVVLAHSDPGVANWLDTAGARRGLIFVRILLPEDQPEALETRVVKLGQIGRGERRFG